MSDSRKRTKREAKALKHRNRKREQPDQAELPEQDLVLEDEDTPKSKKRKLTVEAEPAEASAKKRKEIKGPRYICFVGQLSYNVTAEQLTLYFEKACSERPEVRLLTKKTEEGKTVSKGAAFVEFKTSAAMQEALQLHQTKLGGRKIMVELTVGGGGKGESRQAKLASAKARLSAQRAKKPASTIEAGVEPVEELSKDSKVQTKNAKRKEKLASEGKAKPAKTKRPIKPSLSGANAMKLG